MLRRRLVVLASTLILAGGFAVLGSVNSASASLSCKAYSCHGRDPSKNYYNCVASVGSTKSATAYNSRGVALATVKNIYSYGCVANWAQGQLTQAGLNAGDVIFVDIYTTDSQGHYEYMCIPGPSNTGNLKENCSGFYGGSQLLYTDMVDGTNVTTAEVSVWPSGTQFPPSGPPIAHASASQ